MPPLNALRAFEAVARAGTLSLAADDLHVTHWAIGKQVRTLEEWLGVPLFERHARKMKLTREGDVLLGRVQSAFHALAEGTEEVRKRPNGRRIKGLVRVNCLPSFALRWLLPRLREFEALHPEITVDLTTTSRRLRYIGNDVDVGVRSGFEKIPHTRSVSLLADRRTLVCSPQILRGRPVQRVRDLEAHTILHTRSTPGAWPGWLAANGAARLVPAREMFFEHTYLQIQAAIEGLGFALVSLPLIESEIASGHLLSPLRVPVWDAPDYVLVVSRDRESDPAVGAFVAWLKRKARERHKRR
ncbi:MAG: LysR substrate-binding domain-containing protein [Steroidobacteraceae bacterium]|jgi:LysR family glycine cleavage system transcriptional activator